MIVVLRTLELLLLFALAGAPISLTLLNRRGLCLPPGAHLLLAPLAGLAALSLVGATAYATYQPANLVVLPFWITVAVAWIALVARWAMLRRRSSVSFGIRWCRASVLRWVPAFAGGLVVIGVYLLPFLRNGQLVFWHYAGSDGYMYMRIAEYIGSVGTGIIPTVTLYDAASGFLASELLTFQHLYFNEIGVLQVFVDKPGTMALLAASARQLGLTTHEAYSPLVISAEVLVYLSLLVFGRRLGMSCWVAPIFAVFGALSPVGWFVGIYTFLGNALALPFLPAMLMLVGPVLRLRTGIFAGLLLAAQTVLFPDGFLVVLAVLGLYGISLAWRARREQHLQSFGAGLAGGVLMFVLGILPFGWDLARTVFERLIQVMARGPADAVERSVRATQVVENAPPLARMLGKVDFIWPGFNLNTIPPQPLKPEQAPFALLLGVLLIVYMAAAIWSRRIGPLFTTLCGLLMLLVVGVVGGILQSDYEVFRAIGMLSFVPLAVLFVLGPELRRSFRSPEWQATSFVFSVAAVVTLLAVFAWNDYSQFYSGVTEDLGNSRYTMNDIRDREKVKEIVGDRTVIVSSEAPSFTAFAHAIILFSSTHIAPTHEFYNFVFFNKELRDTRDDRPYLSELVLRNQYYGEISEPLAAPSVYEGENFRVVENDLVPFFNNDTFPTVHPYPSQFRQVRHLELARVLTKPTEVAFFSRQERTVQITMRTAPDKASTLAVSVDGGPSQALAVAPDGTVQPLTLRVGIGLHKVAFEAPPSPTPILQWRLDPLP